MQEPCLRIAEGISSQGAINRVASTEASTLDKDLWKADLPISMNRARGATTKGSLHNFSLSHWLAGQILGS